MQGNLHVPFLGGLAGAIPPGYPALWKQAARHCALSLPNDEGQGIQRGTYASSAQRAGP